LGAVWKLLGCIPNPGVDDPLSARAGVEWVPLSKWLNEPWLAL